MLKSDYEEGASVETCLKLAVKVLNKTMDSTTPTPEKMEFTMITRVNGKVGDACSLGCCFLLWFSTLPSLVLVWGIMLSLDCLWWLYLIRVRLTALEFNLFFSY